MRVFAALLFLTLAGYCSTQVISFGPCPDIRPVYDFDVHRYAGRWYEIARFYRSDEEGLRCQTQNYTVKDSYLLSNESGIDVQHDRSYSYLYPIKNVSTWNTGILYYASDDPLKYVIPYVDYGKYGVNFVCTEYLNGLINVQYNWIIARDRTMSEEDYDSALQNLASMGMNVKKFIKADQRECPNYRDDDQSPYRTDEPEIVRALRFLISELN